jgi:signal transduction histidine kinase
MSNWTILSSFNRRTVCATAPAAGEGAATADHGWLGFDVQDTGPGIASDVQATLFEPYTQASLSTWRQHGGESSTFVVG